MGKDNDMGTISAFYFKGSDLEKLASEYSERFSSGKPFPHVVIPNFLPESIAQAIGAEFPDPNAINWRVAGPGDAQHSGDKNIEKISTSQEEMFPPLIRHMMHEFNSGIFLSFIEKLTGFKGLAPDPWYHGCGLHSTGRGGRLMIHADASRHPNPRFDQILNMIYYATPNWREEWGGHLELWNEDASECISKVAPQFNSMLIFFTGVKSYHGHPHPLTTPPDVRRNSLAAYYYTTDRKVDETYSGYKNYVQWKRTNNLDRKTSLYHRSKEFARDYLPARVVNRMASFVRRMK
jgi:Rps23 Pro-64 3,4-dihydroxylase Tpa1-like proline 4-hydroxylase